MMRTTLIALFLAGSLASAGDTEAEKQYRDAWWRESSESDLPKALAAYRRAAAADGPAEVRAKALLKVAECLKRLDKAQEAMQVLDRLRKQHPTQRQVLAKADRLSKEWTAIDLRGSYSEWYRRYLFSPAFQQRVVDRVLVMSSDNDAAEWLLSLGEAAIPALREALKSKHAELVGDARDLLVLLGDLPPAKLMLDNQDWTRDSDVWSAILSASAESRAHVAQEITSPEPVARLLKAAATSPAALIKAMAGDAGARIATNDEKAAGAIIEALFYTRDTAVHQGIADLGVHPKSPVSLRPIAAEHLLEFGWIGGTANDWLEWARDCDKFDDRQAAFHRVGRTLRPGDEEVIDSVFDDLLEIGKIRRDLQFSLAGAFADGLQNNGMSQQLSWSPERLLTYFRVCLNPEEDDSTSKFIGALRSDRSRGTNVAQALLLEPEKFEFTEDDGFGQLWNVFSFNVDDPDEAMAQARWNRWIMRGIQRGWSTWTEERRLAVVRLAYHGLVGHASHQRALGELMTKMSEGQELSEKLAPAIKKLRERSDDC